MSHKVRFDFAKTMIKEGVPDWYILNWLSQLPDYNEKMAKFHLKQMREMK